MGMFEGVTGILVIVFIVIAVVLIATVVALSIIRGSKEEREEKKKAEAAAKKKADNAVVETPAVEPAKEEVKPEPVIEPVKEEIKPEPVIEPVKEEVKPEPVVEPVKEEVQPEPVVEPVKEEVQPEPVVEPIKEVKKGVDKPNAPKKVVKKPDDWSKYDGEYEGFYYDPEDACYYEGKPNAATAKKLAAKKAELDAANAKTGKKVVIKKIAPPFATLKTPKHPRQEPVAVAGFDEAAIYGKYVIEHVGDEYFYTLYSNDNKTLYESGNYASLEYCKSAIQRFKTHALVGVFTIEEKEGKFNFVLKRKSYSHRGSAQNSIADAEKHGKDVKYFAQTDIVREQ